MDNSIPGQTSPKPQRPHPTTPGAGTPLDPPRAPWGLKKVRDALGLAVWEVELAAETGLLRRLPDRRFEATGVELALADLAVFRERLAAEHRLNASEAASRLGISRQRFVRVVKQAGLEPIAEEQVHKYRTVLTVRYYRAADVDALQLYVSADIALREAATTIGRSDAARKAARTRTRNRQRARAARLELDSARPAAEAPLVIVLRYAAGLAVGRPRQPSFLRRFKDDPAVRRLAALVAECRLSDTEHAGMLADSREQAHVAYQALAGPDEIRRRLNVEPNALVEHADMIGWFMERSVLAAWEADPPEWLLAEYAAQAAAAAEQATHRARDRSRQQVLKAAERATSRLTDHAVAELFGLPVDVIAQLRPSKRRHWNWQHITQLKASPPAWLRDEDAARAEATRRTAQRHRTENRRAEKRERWRQTWAQEMGVPVERVPKHCGNPTTAAVRSAKANRPPWARD